MVPVSNVVGGLWFGSKRERTNSLNMDQQRRGLPTYALKVCLKKDSTHVCLLAHCSHLINENVQTF